MFRITSYQSVLLFFLLWSVNRGYFNLARTMYGMLSQHIPTSQASVR